MKAFVATCPACAAPSTVLDSRPSKRSGFIRRRRKCVRCPRRWSTFEVNEDDLKIGISYLDRMNVRQALALISKVMDKAAKAEEDE